MRILLTKNILSERNRGRRKGVCVTILVILTTATLLSCDSFFLNPSARINPMDPNIPLTGFRAFPVSNEEVQLMWDWFDLERDVRGVDPIYDKIVVSHSKNSYPDSRFGGEEFSISDFEPSSDILQKTVFSDLEREREHYFALYGHEKDGGWTAPMYASAHIGNYYEEWVYPPGIENVFLLDTTVTSSHFTISNQTNVTTFPFLEDIAIPVDTYPDTTYIINFWNEEYWQELLIEAKLYFNYTGDTGAVEIYPVRLLPPEGEISFTEFWEDNVFIDRTVKKVFSQTSTVGALAKIDITDVVSRAYYHGTGSIFFWATPDSNYKIETEPWIEIRVTYEKLNE